MAPMGACLSDSTVQQFFDGQLGADGVASLERHVDDCASCRRLLSHTARALGSRSAAPRSGVATLGPRVLADGVVVADRYRVTRLLGRGGMGEVYEVEDLTLRERVALKTVHAGLAHDERMVERLKREVQLARRVTHECACRVFDVGEDGEVVFLTMELIAGETLSEVLDRESPLEPRRAWPIARQVAAALETAHRAGVIHRDLKSANIMLTGAARVVLTDFGLSRVAPLAETTESAGHVVGTAAYLAPEVVEGGEATPAVDIYALGVVMYEMATGALPFVGPSPVATAAMRLVRRPRAPHELYPGVDRRWERLILRCLALAPTSRPNASEVVEALASLAAQAPRRRWLLPLIVPAAAALAVGAYVALHRAPASAPAPRAPAPATPSPAPTPVSVPAPVAAPVATPAPVTTPPVAAPPVATPPRATKKRAHPAAPRPANPDDDVLDAYGSKR
jgi:tRNA A-37 threonylcarbamoyl transferase component Bud32